MKKLSIYLILLVIISVTFASCEKDEDQETDKAEYVALLIPIYTGNIWTYKSTNYNADEENIDTTRIEVGEKVIINGVTCYAFIEEQPSNVKFVGGNDSFGNFVTYGGVSNNDTTFIPSVQFKKTALAGEQWDYTMVSYDDYDEKFNVDTIPIKCISADTLITTPLGEFHCLAYAISINSNAHTFRYYISSDLGIVKKEHFEGENLFSFDVLIDYHLNKLCK